MTDPEQVWPDRFGVDIKTTDEMRNPENYTELNFRSLGSYTLSDLERIALESDAF